MKKKRVSFSQAAFFSILIFSVPLSVLSCSEGVFNFNSQTGNISFYFTVENSGGDSVSRIVFNFSESSGAAIRKEYSLESSGVSCWIPRVDAGEWQVTCSVYLSDGSLAAERTDSFSLDLAQTAMAEYSYYSDGTSRSIDISWEKSGGSEIIPMVSIDRVDTYISSYCSNGMETSYTTALLIQGAGFDTSMNGMRLTFPDSDVFEYNGGSARAISDLTIEAAPSLLTVSRKAYSTQGNYSVTLTDLNGVEVTGSDSCTFGFDSVDAAAVITGYTAGSNQITTGEYDKRNSTSAGSYLLYVVSKTDGTIVNDIGAISNPPIVSSDTSAAGTLIFPAGTGGLAGGDGTGYFIVLVTLDAPLSQSEVDSVFSSGTTNLSPNNLFEWLFVNFSDRINFVGISLYDSY